MGHGIRFGALGDRTLPLFLDQIGKLLEEVRGVVWPGRGFRVILHAENWQLFVPHSLDSAVV